MIEYGEMKRTILCGITGTMVLFAVGAVPVGSFASGASLWPTGGLTFDFKAISDRRFDYSGVPTADDPRNLIPADDVAAPLPHGYEKWHEFRCINDDAVPPGSPYHRGLVAQVPMDRRDGVYHVVKAKALRDFCARNGAAEKYRTFEGTWRKYVRLPDAKGGSFRVSCRYRMSHDLPQTGYPITGCIIIHSWKIDPKTGDYVHCGYFPLTHFQDCDGWTGIAADFDVPEGPEIVSLQFRHDGIGEFFVKDMALVRRACAEGEGVTISLVPAQAMDGSFAVSSGQCGQLTWGWRKNGPDAFNPSDSEFRLALPAGFEFVGDTFADSVSVARASDGSSVTTFTVKDPAYVPGPGLISWNMPAMLVRATGAAGTDGVMSLSAWRNGRRTGDSGPIRIFTSPNAERAVADASPSGRGVRRTRRSPMRRRAVSQSRTHRSRRMDPSSPERSRRRLAPRSSTGRWGKRGKDSPIRSPRTDPCGSSISGILLGCCFCSGKGGSIG